MSIAGTPVKLFDVARVLQEGYHAFLRALVTTYRDVAIQPANHRAWRRSSNLRPLMITAATVRAGNGTSTAWVIRGPDSTHQTRAPRIPRSTHSQRLLATTEIGDVAMLQT